MKLWLAVCNPAVGDIDGNRALIESEIKKAIAANADAVVLPELVLSGYSPEDLLLRDDFLFDCDNAITHIAHTFQSENITIIFGAPRRENNQRYNSAVVIQSGHSQFIDKTHLPNNGVFDECRYFSAAAQIAPLIEISGILCGILICEDTWQPDVAAAYKAAGAQCLISLNASPYHQDKHVRRSDMLAARYAEVGLSIAYVNLLGGQDDFVFDGGVLSVGKQGVQMHHAYFESSGVMLEISPSDEIQGNIARFEMQSLGHLEAALVLGIRDYIHKNGFEKIVLGLSGGIDSAVTLALAVKALGADNCTAVMMPSQYTAQMSQSDAQVQAQTLGVAYHTVTIEEVVGRYQASLNPVLPDVSAEDITHQNLQARSRGVLLMAVSNHTGALLLSTGNKSEMSVGYATLYGDMAGAYAPLKDVFKQKVYALAKWLNRESEMIPARVIERPPSAELASEQQDSDNLPPYEVLDEILHLFIEKDASVKQIVQAGFDEAVVRRVVWLVKVNEHKRNQSAPGPRVTQRSLSRDRRYPLTSKYTF